MSLHRIRRLPSFSLALLTGVAATVALAAPARAADPTYAALGDSYTSGPGINPVDSSAPSGCGRSAANYPHLVATRLGLRLDDRSCAGAKTENVTTTSQFAGQPPQISALTGATKVATLSIGGNDNNTFRDVVTACIAADSLTPIGTPCKDRYGSTFVETIRADAPVIGAAIAKVRQKAPGAKVFVVGYPDILPHGSGCYPQVPITTGDVAYVDGIERELNTVLRTQAQANGAVFVDTYTPSIGHDACKPESTRWVEPLISGSSASSLHPNAAGMRATADVVAAAIRGSGIE